MPTFVETISRTIKPCSVVFRSTWDLELKPKEFQPIRGDGHWRQAPAIPDCVRSSFNTGAILRLQVRGRTHLFRLRCRESGTMDLLRVWAGRTTFIWTSTQSKIIGWQRSATSRSHSFHSSL